MSEFDSPLLAHVSLRDRPAIRQCIEAILDGPFIWDWEFSLRLGVDRSRLRQVFALWPNLETDEAAYIINNCMNEACNGAKISDEQWEEWFDFPRERVRMIFDQWRSEIDLFKRCL